MADTVPHSSTNGNQKIPKTPGIYRIVCKPTGRFYVGSTVNLYKRKCEHLSQLRKDIHNNRYLQRAWNKYGEQAFIFEIIEFVLLPEMLTAREQYFFQKLKPFGKRGFNLAHEAGSNLGIKQTPETIEKRVQKTRGRFRPSTPNTYRTEGEITYITLTQGYEAMIDTADLEYVHPVRWRAAPIPRTKSYLACGKIKGKYITLSRYLTGAKASERVNHLNYDTMDYRRPNLQVTGFKAPYHQNISTASLTGVRGVSIYQHKTGTQVYIFQCQVCHVSKNFPYTEDGLEAAHIYSETHFAARVSDSRNTSRGENQIRANSNSKTGIRGVYLNKNREGVKSYRFKCKHPACPEQKYFPHTEEGLEAARVFSEAHYAALSQ